MIGTAQVWLYADRPLNTHQYSTLVLYTFWNVFFILREQNKTAEGVVDVFCKFTFIDPLALILLSQEE